MNIRLAEITDKATWDAFVAARSDASPYHLFAWREAVEKAYGHQGYYLMAEENGQTIGILPLVFMQCPLLYKKIVSLPFCDVGGILAARNDVAQQLFDKALVVAKRLEARTIELRCQDALAALQKTELPCTTSTEKVSMILHLPGSSDALWDGFKSKLRSQVRKAEKNALTFSWGKKTNRKDFYNVFSQNMKELGSPVHSRGWIESVLDGYDVQARMGLVYHGVKPIGAGIVLCQGRKVSIPWASTLREYNSFSPNMLLYWNFLKFASDGGYSIFDFGRSTFGEGTYKFKAQWGAEPQPLYWHTIHFDRPALAEKTNTSQTSGNRERLASLWAMLPLAMTNFLGPLLRKHISL